MHHHDTNTQFVELLVR